MRVSKLLVSLAVAMLPVLLVSCATSRTVKTTEPADLAAPPGTDGLKVVGYTTTDGVFAVFYCHQRVAEIDLTGQQAV